ncbi:MAG: 4Fe-4S dicluster-binding protein [Acidobacteriota bacterium]
MSETSNPSAAVLKKLGQGLFLLGFAVFVASLGLSEYRITDEVIQGLSDSGAVTNGIFLEELGELKDQSFRSPFAFVAQLDAKIVEANAREAWISQWDVDNYKTAVAKAASTGPVPANVTLFFWLTFMLASAGALIDFLARLRLEPAGIKNNGIFHSKAKSRGWIGIAAGVFFIGFYILLYFYPFYITNWIRLADPVSHALRGQAADRWFFYGLLYTFCVLVMGVRFAVNYRHSKYQLVRTASVTFFQLGFAFLIPAIMVALNKPSYDLKLAWPLDYGFFADYNINSLISSGTLGWAILLWGIALAILVVPALAVFFGKRWYCSWVCGCGGLAETLGDPYRHLSDKSVKAWRIERWLIHAVLVFAVVMTAAVLADFFTGRSGEALFGGNSWKVRSWYGFLIGSIFAGVVGTGFYPLMGNRVWCRFGCPLAAILGMVQKYQSRFRITTNGGQCISCGNCSTYCEQGIDVRWYAQRGQNIIRSSCVGCGICSQVCPRGVLRLENGPMAGRYNEVSLVQIGQGRIDIG